MPAEPVGGRQPRDTDGMPASSPGRAAPPLRSHSSGRRAPDETLAVRAPALYRRFTAMVMRLPLESRLRCALIGRVIRQQYQAFGRRDFELVRAIHDRDVEIIMARAAGSVTGADLENVYRGHAGLRRLWGAWLEPWEDFCFRPVRIVAVDAERVLVLCQMEARGAGSGLELNQPIGQLYTVRRGRVVRQDNYWSWEEALQAVGFDS